MFMHIHFKDVEHLPSTNQCAFSEFCEEMRKTIAKLREEISENNNEFKIKLYTHT